MAINNWFPVLITNDVQRTRGFYERYFGLVPRFDSDWYVHLAHPTNPQIEMAVMTAQHDSLPTAARTPAAGVLLSFEVPDASAAHDELVGMGAELVHGLRDEAWGQRHFMLRAPDGVFIDVIERIAPTTEYATGYVGAQA